MRYSQALDFLRMEYLYGQNGNDVLTAIDAILTAMQEELGSVGAAQEMVQEFRDEISSVRNDSENQQN